MLASAARSARRVTSGSPTVKPAEGSARLPALWIRRLQPARSHRRAQEVGGPGVDYGAGSVTTTMNPSSPPAELSGAAPPVSQPASPENQPASHTPELP